jgi:hypothetical protein
MAKKLLHNQKNKLLNQRYEVKMIFSENQMQYFYDWMYRFTSAYAPYPSRYVNSIYFDDLNYSSVRDNLSGISNRKKYRIRYYNNLDLSNNEPMNFEIKYKVGRVGYKSVHKINNRELYKTEICYSDLQSMVLNSLDFSKDDAPESMAGYIIPTLKVTYNRLYFETINGIRITIDNMINYKLPSQTALVSEHADDAYPNTVVELKFDLDKKDEVARLLCKSSFTPKRHSKYLIGLSMYKQLIYY